MTTTWIKSERQPGCTSDGDLKSCCASETINYKVYYSDVNATGFDARNATDVPAYGDGLFDIAGDFTGLIVTKKTATQNTSNGAIWDVTVTYSTLDPTQQPPKPDGFSSGDKYGVNVTAQATPIQVPLQKTIDSTPQVITNTLGEPIDPPLTTVVWDVYLNVTFWSDKVDQTNITACKGKTNNGTVSITIGASSWSLSANTFYFASYGWTANADISGGGAPVFQTTYQFNFRSETWTNEVPNMSFHHKNDSGKIVPNTDDAVPPKEFSTPRYLDADGAIIPDGGDAYLLTFNTIKTADFTGLLTGVP